MKLVFLLEERSMAAALEGILPRLIPEVEFLCIPHEGKQDLEKSIPRKLRGWREPGVQFIVVRDQDSGDCHHIKNKLTELCLQGGHKETLVRIACRELESWFLGDWHAIEKCFGHKGLINKKNKKNYRNPDVVGHPFQEMKKLIPSYQKISGARCIGKHLDLINIKSHSFTVFIRGILELINR